MSAYTGTGQLLRLAWRRDRLLIPVTVATLTALSVGSAQATRALYPTDQAAVEGLGGILSNPAVSAMYGPVVVNRGGLSVFKTVMLGAVFLGILTHALVRRHTRVEEEDGRFELIGAGVVGRRAPLTAAVVLALLARSKYEKWEGFGMNDAGPILLQDHGNNVSFRNLKIRPLNNAPNPCD